jgi:rhodanese-related sulfurtransferase
MKKVIVFFIAVAISTSFLYAKTKKKGSILKKEGVKIEYYDESDKRQSAVIKRIHDPACAKFKMSPDLVWGKGLAKVPAACQQSYITTIGKISPIKIADGIDTYGELEVIEFIKNLASDRSKLFIDTRTSGWYYMGTIPGAINLPFEQFDGKKLPDEFEDILDIVNVTVDKGVYDFSKAKTLLLFCNGVWCPQSGWAIENLIKIGYPKEKLKWYRGGLYSWTQVGLTVEVVE